MKNLMLKASLCAIFSISLAGAKIAGATNSQEPSESILNSSFLRYVFQKSAESKNQGPCYFEEHVDGVLTFEAELIEVMTPSPFTNRSNNFVYFIETPNYYVHLAILGQGGNVASLTEKSGEPIVTEWAEGRFPSVALVQTTSDRNLSKSPSPDAFLWCE